MSFDWLTPNVLVDNAAERRKAHQMYERELTERSALLFRLGFNKKEIKLRLKSNVRWDFELHEQPEHLRKIDKIVNDVVSR